MDWSKSSHSKSQPRGSDAVTFRSDRTPTKDFDFSNELYQNLKRNYEDRLASLEQNIRETYNLIDNDEIVSTMKQNAVSDDYRKQRINEILEDSLLQEKEIQIEKLNQVNAYLKTELRKAEDEKTKIKQVYQEEVMKFQKTFSDFESVIEQEARAKTQYKQEYELIASNLQKLSRQNEDLLADREAQLYESSQMYQAEMTNMKNELNFLREKALNEESNAKRKDSLIMEMQKDLEIFRREYAALEFNYTTLLNEHSSVTKKSAAHQEITTQYENEIKNLREQLQRVEEEFRNCQGDLGNVLKEKTDLLSKTEYISSQVKKIVETEQKASAEMVDEVKRKYKDKIADLKKQIADLTEANDSLNSEIGNWKYQLEDSKNNHERIVAQLQNDMKVIKNEWDKKCQEIDLSSQRTIAEMKAKHQMQINQLQTEYQLLLDRRLNEIQNEAQSQIHKSKGIDMEIKAQLESRITQIEKDYILKTKHDNILTTEILDLKTRHAQEFKEFEDRNEREFSQKLKEITEKNKFEYESVISALKSKLQHLDLELNKSRNEIQKLIEGAAADRERAQRLAIELDDSERVRKDYAGRFEDATQNLVKIKAIFEEEQRKFKRSESETAELRRKMDDLNHRIEELNQYSSNLKNELQTLGEIKVSHEEKIDELSYQIRALNNENEHLKYNLTNIEKERNELIKRVKDLNEELSEGSQRLLDALGAAKQQENERLEEEINEKLKIQTRLTQTEGRVRHMTNETAEKDKKLVELKNTVSRLENVINEVNTKCLNLETDLAARDNTIRDQHKKFDRLQAKVKESSQNARKFLSMKLVNLKSDINAISNSHALELEMNRKSLQGIVNEVLKYFKEKIQTNRQLSEEEKKKAMDQMSEEFQVKLKEFELSKLEDKYKDQTNYDRIIKNHQYEIENYRRDLENSKDHVRELNTKIDELNQFNNTLKAKIEKGEKDYQALKDIHVQKVEEFEKLQAFVHKELKRIKEESQTVMDDTIKQLQEEHDKDLKNLTNIIDELKQSNLWRLKKFEEEINKLQNTYASDQAQLKALYDSKLSEYEKDHASLENEIRSRKRENTALKNEVDSLKETYNKLREENQRAFVGFEEKIESFKDIMKQDSEKYVTFRSQANAEIERYKKESREAQRELNEKNAKVEELLKIKEELKMELEKYKNALHLKEKQIEQQGREVVKATKTREKEIEELQTLLNKSMQTFGSKTQRDKV